MPRSQPALPGRARMSGRATTRVFAAPPPGRAGHSSGSAVACGTLVEFADVVLLDQLLAEPQLSERLTALTLKAESLKLPGREFFGAEIHDEDLVARSDVLLGLAVTVEAPLHQQGAVLIDRLHLIDAAVAAGAADALGDVDAVVEIDEVGQLVDALPPDRVAPGVTAPHRLEHGAANPNRRVTVHARLGRRDAGERRHLDGRVAVATINPQAVDVMGVAELDRLGAGDADVGDVGGPQQDEARPGRPGENDDAAEDAQPRQHVEAAVEDLGHPLLREADARLGPSRPACTEQCREAAIPRPIHSRVTRSAETVGRATSWGGCFGRTARGGAGGAFYPLRMLREMAEKKRCLEEVWGGEKKGGRHSTAMSPINAIDTSGRLRLYHSWKELQETRGKIKD